MAREVVERAARRHHVDEPEQRSPQLLVARGELHRPGVERPHRMARDRGKCGRELAADAPDLVLERAIGHHARMLTARATTSPTVTSAVSACAAISSLAARLSGIASVGLNAVAFVNDTYR